MNLDDYRKKIDALDTKILKLLAERLSLMPKIIAYKEKHGLKVYQPKREKAVLEKKTEKGHKWNLSEGFIKDIFQRIMKESRNMQRKHKKK